MKLPRNLSGGDLIGSLCKAYGYRVVHRAGSHVVLETDSPRKHRIVVPAHKAVRVGTLSGILRAVAQARDLRKEQVAQELFH